MRGGKPEFTDVLCPGNDCKFYGISGLSRQVAYQDEALLLPFF